MNNDVQIYKNNTVMPISENDVGMMKNLSKLFCDSGLFQDTRTASQAFVKIMAGRELGLQPFVSMSSIDIIRGRVVIKPVLLAGKIKESDKYDYKIVESTKEICVIDFYENGEVLGQHQFSIDDARQAKLVKADSAWVKYPQDMLYHRTMSSGVKRYFPDLFMMSVYVDDEIPDDENPIEPDVENTAATVLEQSAPKENIKSIIGDAILNDKENGKKTLKIPAKDTSAKDTPAKNIKPAVTEPTEQKPKTNNLNSKSQKPESNVPHPHRPELIRVNFAKISLANDKPITADDAYRVNTALNVFTIFNKEKNGRILDFLFGQDDATKLTVGQGNTIISWLQYTKTNEGEMVPADDWRLIEMETILKMSEAPKKNETDWLEKALTKEVS